VTPTPHTPGLSTVEALLEVERFGAGVLPLTASSPYAADGTQVIPTIDHVTSAETTFGCQSPSQSLRQ